MLAVIVALAGCYGNQRSVAFSPEGCGFTIENPCRASFSSLAANKKDYNGVFVRLEGYLAVNMNLFVIYASKEFYEAGVNDEAFVRIRGPLDEQKRIFDKFSYKWVALVGRFELGHGEGTMSLPIGEIHGPFKANDLGFDAPRRRQQFGEVVIEMQDVLGRDGEQKRGGVDK